LKSTANVTGNSQAVDRLLDEAIHAKAFPGAALVVTRGEEIALERYAGHLTYDKRAHVNADTIYDLASLTKVLVTTPLMMWLVEAGRISLEQPLVSIVPEFKTNDDRRERITFAHLLTHTSGLPAHRKYYEHARTHEAVLAEVFATRLEADPSTRTEYSDIGFILLGVAIERLAGASLDQLAEHEIFAKLDLLSEFGPLYHVGNVAPTLEAVDFRMRQVHGSVNDENAWVMGGVAGHAGLFGTARDVSVFARCMLRGGAPLFKSETVERFTSMQLGTSRALGWDTPTQPSQSGKYLSPCSYGHLGYSGTSLWIDPERELSITLLTNRTYPDNKSQEIKRFRPLIHDAVIESLHLQ
jgi:CubicO group peptidase (beta-lactamase class C family)